METADMVHQMWPLTPWETYGLIAVTFACFLAFPAIYGFFRGVAQNDPPSEWLSRPVEDDPVLRAYDPKRPDANGVTRDQLQRVVQMGDRRRLR